MKSYHDIAGDGGSNILEQVGAQRGRIAENLAGVRHLLAVGSGKGGVGKSTLTARLAAALAAPGRRVAILDADFNGPSQARLFGLDGPLFLPGREGLALPRSKDGIGVISMGSVVPESRAVDFDSVSSGESYTWRATQEFTALGQLLASVEWGALDVLLFDLPPGAERTFQYAEFLGRRAAFVLVTIPTDLARGVVARSVAALEKAGGRLLGYVENMSGYLCTGCGEVRPLFPSREGVALDTPLLARVPFDPRVAEASDHGALPDPAGDTPVAVAVRELAARVINELDAHAEHETTESAR